MQVCIPWIPWQQEPLKRAQGGEKRTCCSPVADVCKSLCGGLPRSGHGVSPEACRACCTTWPLYNAPRRSVLRPVMWRLGVDWQHSLDLLCLAVVCRRSLSRPVVFDACPACNSHVLGTVPGDTCRYCFSRSEPLGTSSSDLTVHRKIGFRERPGDQHAPDGSFKKERYAMGMESFSTGGQLR